MSINKTCMTVTLCIVVLSLRAAERTVIVQQKKEIAQEKEREEIRRQGRGLEEKMTLKLSDEHKQQVREVLDWMYKQNMIEPMYYPNWPIWIPGASEFLYKDLSNLRNTLVSTPVQERLEKMNQFCDRLEIEQIQ